MRVPAISVKSNAPKMRLFECIRAVMEKGSPEGYDAETRLSRAGSETSSRRTP